MQKTIGISSYLSTAGRVATYRSVFRKVQVRAVAPPASIAFVMNNYNNRSWENLPTQQPISMNNYTGLYRRDQRCPSTISGCLFNSGFGPNATNLESVVEGDGRKVLHVIKRQIQFLEPRQRPNSVQVANSARREPQDSEIRERTTQISKGRQNAPPLQAKLCEERQYDAQVIHLASGARGGALEEDTPCW